LLKQAVPEAVVARLMKLFAQVQQLNVAVALDSCIVNKRKYACDMFRGWQIISS
jgi:hypothetical protein